MASVAAVGLRAHSGWAAAVALVQASSGPAGAPIVAVRRRIEMKERGARGPSQPYHAAVGLDFDEARQMLSASAARAAGLAAIALREMVGNLRELGHEVIGCGLLLASGKPLPPLERILASHPLLHTAEGELFREALRAASRECGLPVTEIRERELFARAAADLRLPAARVEREVAAMGKAIGPPWRQDEKFAAAAAWIVLGRR